MSSGQHLMGKGGREVLMPAAAVKALYGLLCSHWLAGVEGLAARSWAGGGGRVDSAGWAAAWLGAGRAGRTGDGDARLSLVPPGLVHLGDLPLDVLPPGLRLLGEGDLGLGLSWRA